MFYMGLSFAMFVREALLFPFVFLSLVVITDTHSCNFFFRVPEIKKWESGSTLHILPSSLTSHSTSALSVSHNTSHLHLPSQSHKPNPPSSCITQHPNFDSLFRSDDVALQLSACHLAAPAGNPCPHFAAVLRPRCRNKIV